MAIASNDFLVPVEGVLAVAFKGFEVKVIAVNVDEAVAFLDTLVGRNEVNGRPRIVAHHFHPIGDGQMDLLDMVAEVVDAVGVMNLAILCQAVVGPEAIFRDENRQAVAAINFSDSRSEADRVNFLAEFGLD